MGDISSGNFMASKAIEESGNKCQNEVKGIFTGWRYCLEARPNVLSLFQDHFLDSPITN